jgi:hypothetical protein
VGRKEAIDRSIDRHSSEAGSKIYCCRLGAKFVSLSVCCSEQPCYRCNDPTSLQLFLYALNSASKTHDETGAAVSLQLPFCIVGPCSHGCQPRAVSGYGDVPCRCLQWCGGVYRNPTFEPVGRMWFAVRSGRMFLTDRIPIPGTDWGPVHVTKKKKRD